MTKVLTGTFKDAGNNPVANGTLYLKLSNDAVVIGTGQVVAAQTLAFPLDASGTLGTGITIWANDELTPPTTVYTATVQKSGGGQVYGPDFFSITGVSPINLNSLTPASGSPVVFSQAVLTNPTAPQTITGQQLTLTNTVPLTVAGTATIASLAPTNLLQPNQYNGVNLAGAGLATVQGTSFQSAQGANIGPITVVSNTQPGSYRVSAYIQVVRAATTSSTLPAITVNFSDGFAFTAQALALTPTNNGNTTTTFQEAVAMVSVQAATNITYSTSGFASVGATSMQYTLRVVCEYTGL